MAGRISSFSQCVSELERKQRTSVNLINGILWVGLVIGAICSMGALLLIAAIGWLLNYLTAEYQVRKIQAVGVTVSSDQLPIVYQAVSDVCSQFGLENKYRVIVVHSGEANAFALRFARKRVVVILSDLLEGIINHPGQLRAIIAHELCHSVLDHGWPGALMLYKPAKFRQGREMTCDNAGLVAAGNISDIKMALLKLCVGKNLYKGISEEALIKEAQFIESGLVGWFVKQHLSHPPFGRRIANVIDFSRHNFVASPAVEEMTLVK